MRLAPVRILVRLMLAILLPRHRIGVAVVIMDGNGRVLLLEHTVRASCPWGLPGGWLESGEDPAAGVRREVREELGLEFGDVDVILCERSPIRRHAVARQRQCHLPRQVATPTDGRLCAQR